MEFNAAVFSQMALYIERYSKYNKIIKIHRDKLRKNSCTDLNKESQECL